MNRIYIILFFLFISLVGKGQTSQNYGTPNVLPTQGNPNATMPFNSTVQFKIGYIDAQYLDTLSANLAPQNIKNIPFYNIATLIPYAKWYRDTVHHAWIQWQTNVVTGTGVDTIYRTKGKDSIQFTIGGRYGAILDSLGSGGVSTNFANADLTATGDRVHNFNHQSLEIDSISYMSLVSDGLTTTPTGFQSSIYQDSTEVLLSNQGLTDGSQVQITDTLFYVDEANTTGTSNFRITPNNLYYVNPNTFGKHHGYVLTLLNDSTGLADWELSSGGSGGINIYNTDSSLLTNRTVHGNGKFLSFNGQQYYSVGTESGISGFPFFEYINNSGEEDLYSYNNASSYNNIRVSIPSHIDTTEFIIHGNSTPNTNIDYVNFLDSISGNSGFGGIGFRDSLGIMQFKNAGNRWTNIGTGSSSTGHTIYNADDSLTGNRNVGGAGHNLTFSNLNTATFNINTAFQVADSNNNVFKEIYSNHQTERVLSNSNLFALHNVDSSGNNTWYYNKGVTQDTVMNNIDSNLRFKGYPSTRDNSGASTPSNFLYTKSDGTLQSAPISFIRGGIGIAQTIENNPYYPRDETIKTNGHAFNIDTKKFNLLDSTSGLGLMIVEQMGSDMTLQLQNISDGENPLTITSGTDGWTMEGSDHTSESTIDFERNLTDGSSVYNFFGTGSVPLQISDSGTTISGESIIGNALTIATAHDDSSTNFTSDGMDKYGRLFDSSNIDNLTKIPKYWADIHYQAKGATGNLAQVTANGDSTTLPINIINPSGLKMVTLGDTTCCGGAWEGFVRAINSSGQYSKLYSYGVDFKYNPASSTIYELQGNSVDNNSVNQSTLPAGVHTLVTSVIINGTGHFADDSGRVTITSGAGTVSSFSSGNLSGLFNTSVATATTTPALSFTLQSQTAGTVFSRLGSTGIPSFQQIDSSVFGAGWHTQGYYDGIYYPKSGGNLNAGSVIGFPKLVSTPATPSTGFVNVYFNNSSNFSYVNENGLVRSFSNRRATGDTVYYPSAVQNPTLADSATVQSLLNLKKNNNDSAGTGGYTSLYQLTKTRDSLIAIINSKVSSVTNSDGSLTISPTTGAVVAGINVNDSLTWTGKTSFTKTSPTAATTYDGFYLNNTTAATVGAQQYSGAVHYGGGGWKTTATAASQPVDFWNYLVPVQGTTAPTSLLTWDASINSGTRGTVMTLSNTGTLGLGVGATAWTISGAGGINMISGNSQSFVQSSFSLAMQAPTASIGTTSTTSIISTSNNFVAIGTVNAISLLTLNKSFSAAAWGLNGINFTTTQQTFTDNTTAASATVLNNNTNVFNIPKDSATNTGVIITNACTVCIAGAPIGSAHTTIINSYPLKIASGNLLDSGTVISLNSYTNSATPSIAAGTGAGTGPTVSVVGSNQDMTVTVTTGTLPTLSATVATVTFSGSFAYPNRVVPVFSAGNSNAAILSGASMIYMTTGGTPGSYIITAGSTPLTAMTTYVWQVSAGGN